MCNKEVMQLKIFLNFMLSHNRNRDILITSQPNLSWEEYAKTRAYAKI